MQMREVIMYAPLSRCATLDETDWSYYLYIFVTYESKLELLRIYFIHILFSLFSCYSNYIFFFVSSLLRIIDFLRYFFQNICQNFMIII